MLVNLAAWKMMLQQVDSWEVIVLDSKENY